MKAYAVLLLAACVFGADARRELRQVAFQPTLGGAPVAETVRIRAPASESTLFFFSLQELTPSSEAMQESNSLMSALSSPQQFATMVNQALTTGDGLALVAASFSDMMSRGMSQQLASAINQGFAQQQQPIASQAGTSQMASPSQVYTAYSLAILDQISRGNNESAGQAIFWALSGAGGPDLAERVVAQLDAFQANIGCSEPLRSALANAGFWITQASLGSITPAAELATGAMGAQSMSNQDMISNVGKSLSSSPSLFACFQSSYPSLVSLLQQQPQAQQGTGMAGATTGPTTTGTTGPTTTGATTGTGSTTTGANMGTTGTTGTTGPTTTGP